VHGGVCEPARVLAERDHWRVDGDPALAGWILGRTASGFVVHDGATEVGRTMKAVGIAEAWAPRNLLLEDGRLFAIVPRGPREPGLHVTSWEVPGPYLDARPSAGAWTIAPTIAASGIADLRALTLLLAAEIADVEHWLDPPSA
jgi:hypothetical protein